MSSIPRTSGIYKIVCSANGKVYVGSAVDLQARKRGHWYALRTNTHKNCHLQNAWHKYGANRFGFVIIELTPRDLLIEREQYWLDETRSYDRNYGYNVRLIAESNFGIVRSEDVRRKLSVAKIGKKHGPMPQEYRDAISRAKRGEKHGPQTLETITKRVLARKGYRHSPETRKKIGDANRGRKPNEKVRAAHYAALSKTWRVIDPDGNEQVILGLERFCREHNLTAVAMANVAKGKQRHHKGWKCYRVEE